MFQYDNLSPLEFEHLCHDIMQVMLNTRLHRFPAGRDGGIDLADDARGSNIVVQVKHYRKSSFAQLMRDLRQELPKVRKLQPRSYYVCCSMCLLPQQIAQIYALFSDFMASTKNVIAQEAIDAFLHDKAHEDILSRHPKLYLDSLAILQRVLNNHLFIDCEALLAEIKEEQKYFVRTSVFEQALRYLREHRVLMMTGDPGAGKTITSHMLVWECATQGYKVRSSSHAGDFRELKQQLALHGDVPELIYVDDCLGQARFDEVRNQSRELLALIRHVRACPNKMLILNSRVTILNEAREREEQLFCCLERGECREYVLNLNALSLYEKAEIFRGHMALSGLEPACLASLCWQKRYLNIIEHPNFTPRIIQFVCSHWRRQHLAPQAFYDYAMQQLMNPRQLWHDEFEHGLARTDRLLLLTLYSLTQTWVEADTVRACFLHHLHSEGREDGTLDHYSASLARLLENLVVAAEEKGVRMLSMVNPSVNDYLRGRLEAGTLGREGLVRHALLMRQVWGLSNNIEFDAHVRALMQTHALEPRLFENEAQRRVFIAWHVGRFQLTDPAWTPHLHAYLRQPGPGCIYGSMVTRPVDVFRLILQPPVCEAHGLGAFVVAQCDLSRMMQQGSLEEVVECLGLLSGFYAGEHRAAFRQAGERELRRALEGFCREQHAADYEIDVADCIRRSRRGRPGGHGVDVAETCRLMHELAVTKVAAYLQEQLSQLPDDLRGLCGEAWARSCEIHGEEDLFYDYVSLFYWGDDDNWHIRPEWDGEAHDECDDIAALFQLPDETHPESAATLPPCQACSQPLE